jgi:prevent-host-death family protein
MSATVASRELRNATRELLARVEGGEEIIITVRGRPAAVLRPVHDRPRWIGREELLARLGSRQADSGLRAELTELAPDTTEDLER